MRSPLLGIRRLAARRGHGSMMWVAAFTSLALPALSVMVSLQCRYSAGSAFL
jgi:hypothetical protein